jgi:hypothetical protein
MVKIVETDEKATLNTQLEEDIGGAVILLNKFTVQPEDVEQFLKVFQATTKVMKQQPGFISEFRSSMANLPPNTVMSPHLFKKVAVPDICVD